MRILSVGGVVVLAVLACESASSSPTEQEAEAGAAGAPTAEAGAGGALVAGGSGTQTAGESSGGEEPTEAGGAPAANAGAGGALGEGGAPGIGTVATGTGSYASPEGGPYTSSTTFALTGTMTQDDGQNTRVCVMATSATDQPAIVAGHDHFQTGGRHVTAFTTVPGNADRVALVFADAMVAPGTYGDTVATANLDCIDATNDMYFYDLVQSPATWSTFEVDVSQWDDAAHSMTLSFHLVGEDEAGTRIDVSGQMHVEPQ